MWGEEFGAVTAPYIIHLKLDSLFIGNNSSAEIQMFFILSLQISIE